MNRIWIGLLFTAVLVSASSFYIYYKSTSTIHSVEFASQVPQRETNKDSIDVDSDLYLTSLAFRSLVTDKQRFNILSCSSHLDSFYVKMQDVGPEYFNIEKIKLQAIEIIQTFWSVRLSLRDRLTEFYQSGEIKNNQSEEHQCLRSMRTIFRSLRYYEDYVGMIAINPVTFNPNSDLVGDTLRGVAPHLLLNSTQTNGELRIRSGDILMSRGNAFTSAAIAHIGEIDMPFSHIALVYVQNEPVGKEFTIAEARANPNVMMLEAHIEVGSTIRPFKTYLDDGNARVAVFRYPDAQLAHQAAAFSYQTVVNYRDAAHKRQRWLSIDNVNFHLPYDFKMVLDDFNEVYCSEMAYMGYKSVGIIIPTFMTRIATGNDLIKRLGITSEKIYAPGDMDFDTRFELLGEWRDYRKILNLWYKDVILTKMFEWMERLDYKVYPNSKQDMKALFAWFGRRLDLPFTVKELPQNMDRGVISTAFVLDNVGDSLKWFLEYYDGVYQQEHHGIHMSLQQMSSILEQVRINDLFEYQQGGCKKCFHNQLRP